MLTHHFEQSHWLQPFVKTVHLHDKASSAVLAASDGVWDALSFQAAADVALKAADAMTAAKEIVRRAVKARGLRDDTTCVVAATEAIGGTGLGAFSHLARAEDGIAAGTVGGNATTGSKSQHLMDRITHGWLRSLRPAHRGRRLQSQACAQMAHATV